MSRGPQRRLLGASLALLAACGGPDREAPARPVLQNSAGPEASRSPAPPEGAHRHEQLASHVCPFHPEQQSSDADATCPVCGVEMVEQP